MAQSQHEAPGAPPDAHLTPQELAVLQELAAEHKPVAVAVRLCLTELSVRTYIKHINRKLETHSYHASVLVARHRGLL